MGHDGGGLFQDGEESCDGGEKRWGGYAQPWMPGRKMTREFLKGI